MIMKKTTLLLGITILLFTELAASAQKTDFSGNWAINKDQSDFGEISPNSAPLTLKISQKDYWLSIKRHQKYGDSILNYTENLTFDGKSTETKINADVKRTSTAKWSA